MWILGIVSAIFLSFDLYKFLPKYLIFRFGNKKCFALIQDLTMAKWVLGSFPKVNYEVSGKKYKLIVPFHSIFISINDDSVGNEILIYYNPKNPSECVMKADFKVLLQVLITIFVYFGTIYLIMNPS